MGPAHPFRYIGVCGPDLTRLDGLPSLWWGRLFVVECHVIVRQGVAGSSPSQASSHCLGPSWRQTHQGAGRAYRPPSVWAGWLPGLSSVWSCHWRGSCTRRGKQQRSPWFPFWCRGWIIAPMLSIKSFMDCSSNISISCGLGGGGGLPLRCPSPLLHRWGHHFIHFGCWHHCPDSKRAL